MTVKERKLPPGDRRWNESPITRDVLDAIYPYVRLMFGLLFVGFCGLSTIFGFADDLYGQLVAYQDVVVAASGLSIDTLAWTGGVVAAVVIFVIQVVTGERHRRVYALSLIPDIWYSYPWSAVLVRALLPGAADMAAPVLAVGVAYLFARYGEELLFGKRR